MPDILVRGLEAKTVKRLKVRAKRNGRSLQGEAKTILEDAAGQMTWEEVRQGFANLREEFRDRTFPSAAEMIREDRDR